MLLIDSYNEIDAAGQKIHTLLTENLTMLKADVESQAWKMYVDYVDKMIVKGFFVMANCSLQYLLANTEAAQKDSLFEAKMELYVSNTNSAFMHFFLKSL